MQFQDPSELQAPVNAPPAPVVPDATGAEDATGLLGGAAGLDGDATGAKDVANVVGEAAPVVTKTPPGAEAAGEGADAGCDAGAAAEDGEPELSAAALHPGGVALLSGVFTPMLSTEFPGLGYNVSCPSIVAHDPGIEGMLAINMLGSELNAAVSLSTNSVTFLLSSSSDRLADAPVMVTGAQFM